MSITVSITAIQSHTPDVDADEMSNSRRSPSLLSISVGADNPCYRKPLGSIRSFSLTGTIFLSIPSHLLVFSRADHTTTFHVVFNFITTFTEGLLQKASMSIRHPLIGPTAVTSRVAVTSDARCIQSSCQNIRIRY